MSFFSWFNSFRTREPIGPFDTLHHRRASDIYTIIRAAYAGAYIRISDREYSTVPLVDFKKWLKSDDISDKIYHREWYDCDNFAHGVKCNLYDMGEKYKTEIVLCYCEGNSPVGYHAFNLFIDSADNMFILEPQTDVLTPWHRSEYKPDFIQL